MEADGERQRESERQRERRQRLSGAVQRPELATGFNGQMSLVVVVVPSLNAILCVTLLARFMLSLRTLVHVHRMPGNIGSLRYSKLSKRLTTATGKSADIAYTDIDQVVGLYDRHRKDTEPVDIDFYPPVLYLSLTLTAVGLT